MENVCEDTEGRTLLVVTQVSSGLKKLPISSLANVSTFMLIKIANVSTFMLRYIAAIITFAKDENMQKRAIHASFLLASSPGPSPPGEGVFFFGSRKVQTECR